MRASEVEVAENTARTVPLTLSLFLPLPHIHRCFFIRYARIAADDEKTDEFGGILKFKTPLPALSSVNARGLCQIL